LPGGLVKVDESLENAASRILKEKTGIKNILLDQLATFGEPQRDPFGRVISVAYIALVNADNFLLQATTHYDDIK
jgi:8-oxo-dGTP diphosphatase